MPNSHYQRVLEQDQSLPAPVRWLSRAMSSWWTILTLGLFVVGYVFFAHVPIAGKYLWQTRLIDTTQHAMLTWWPLLVAAWLLTAVIIWAAMRRLPWRIDNLGAFVAVLGLAIVLISQSWAFRSQTLAIAAVPITASTGDTQADALSLNYTTRAGDTHDRVLVIMASGGAPVTIPLNNLPRWNDATGQAMPQLKLHDDPKLAAIIGYGTRITTFAYLASAYLEDSTLTKSADGKQTATPTPDDQRNLTDLPYPANALLALKITTDLEDGGTKNTIAWLPFEPEGTDSLVPKKFFPIEGLGSVGLAFRPASKKLPFALAAESLGDPHDDWRKLQISISDTDAQGRLLEPERHLFVPEIDLSSIKQYQASDDEGTIRTYGLSWLEQHENQTRALIAVTSGTSNPFILAGMITFVLGIVLDRLLDWLAGRPTKPKPVSPDKSSIPNDSP